MNPKQLMYTENHEWVRDDGGKYTVGITEYAAEQLGDEFRQDEEAATVESVKAASDVYAPVGGRVVEVNEVLESHPELINDGPYEEGWMFKLKDVNVVELESLMTSVQYDKYLKDL